MPTHPLAHLSTVAASLNLTSDNLTAQISLLESHLAKLNLGIEVWIRLPDTDTADLGYGRIPDQKGRWGLLLRDQGHSWSAMSAPRHLKISVPSAFPQLVEALIVEAERVIGEITQAEALAKEFVRVIQEVDNA